MPHRIDHLIKRDQGSFDTLLRIFQPLEGSCQPIVHQNGLWCCSGFVIGFGEGRFSIRCRGRGFVGDGSDICTVSAGVGATGAGFSQSAPTVNKPTIKMQAVTRKIILGRSHFLYGPVFPGDTGAATGSAILVGLGCEAGIGGLQPAPFKYASIL